MLVGTAERELALLRARFHPEAHARRMREVERQFRLLRPRLALRKVFLELGAGDCALARRVAGYVERAYALDASEQVLHACGRATNLVPMLYDGLSIPLPEASVHVAFAGQGLGHLQPRAALAHLESVRRTLVPGGAYFCVSPDLRLLREAGFRISALSAALVALARRWLPRGLLVAEALR